MKTLLPLVLLLLLSCEPKTIQTDFDERLLDLLIETRNGRHVELPDLYGKVFEIPNLADEKLVLGTKLQARGFKTIETTESVQGITGVRTVTQRFEKDGCSCTVSKTYGRTAFVSEFAVSEKISCE